jgi:hypothetical protein
MIVALYATLHTVSTSPASVLKVLNRESFTSRNTTKIQLNIKFPISIKMEKVHENFNTHFYTFKDEF